MKKRFWALLLLGLAFLFMSGCGKTNSDTVQIPTSPEEINSTLADWLLVFGTGAYAGKPAENVINLFYLKDVDFPLPEDEIIVMADSTNLTLQSMLGNPAVYYGTALLNEGQTYQIVFKHNGVTKLSTSLKMVYGATVSLPSSFDPTQTANISWTLSTNNQFQFASASSLFDDGSPDGQSSDFTKQISASARSYVIPANSVTDFGTGTYYTLGVEQMNYKVTNRIAVMSYHEAYAHYSAKNLNEFNRQILTRAKNLYLSLKK